MIENRLGNTSVVGNSVMKFKSEILEKSVTKVIKIEDSADHCEECMKHNYGEKLDSIGMYARYVFYSITPSMIKCAAGMNHYGERIKKIDKNNETTACLVHGADEYWEHVIFAKRVGKIEKNGRRC